MNLIVQSVPILGSQFQKSGSVLVYVGLHQLKYLNIP